MSDWLAVILLGIIEGITEFLPISSTGHLLIAEHWLTPQSDLFDVVIQSGAVLAVIPLFSKQCQALVCCWRERGARLYGAKILLAFGLTGVGGFFLETNHFTLPETVPPVALALIVGGILFLVVERWVRDRPDRGEVGWGVAIAVGLGQLVAAVFPGASRSGTTILLGLMLGLNRPLATEFSFLVGIPTMLAAGGLKIFKALSQPAGQAAPESWTLVLLGTAVSAVVSFIVVKWLLRFVQTHTFNAFGWYRIGLGGALLLWAS